MGVIQAGFMISCKVPPLLLFAGMPSTVLTAGMWPALLNNRPHQRGPCRCQSEGASLTFQAQTALCPQQNWNIPDARTRSEPPTFPTNEIRDIWPETIPQNKKTNARKANTKQQTQKANTDKQTPKNTRPQLLSSLPPPSLRQRARRSPPKTRL